MLLDNYIGCLQWKRKVKGGVNYPVKADISKLPQFKEKEET